MFQPAPRRHRRLPSGTMVSYAEVKSYLSKREIPQLFESLMAGLMYHRPENHIGYLQSCLDEVKSNSETKVQWSTFVNAKKRKSKEILPPLTPKKQDSFSSSWSDNSRQSTPLPPISARTRNRTSMEQQEFRNTYILYHNPPPILAKPKVPVVSVLGGLGNKIDELCERVVGRLRGVVHISTCSMLKTRMTIEGFYRVTSVPACAVVDSVLQAMSMVQSANALLVAGFPRNRGDIEEYRSRRVRMDGVILVDFEEEALKRFLEHEVASGVVRTSEIDAELERYKQDIISVAEYYDQKELLTVVMGDQDMEEIIDDLVLAVDKVIETRKDMPDEFITDGKVSGEGEMTHDALVLPTERLERPSTVEIRDATEEDIKSIEAENQKVKEDDVDDEIVEILNNDKSEKLTNEPDTVNVADENSETKSAEFNITENIVDANVDVEEQKSNEIQDTLTVKDDVEVKEVIETKDENENDEVETIADNETTDNKEELSQNTRKSSKTEEMENKEETDVNSEADKSEENALENNNEEEKEAGKSEEEPIMSETNNQILQTSQLDITEGKESQIPDNESNQEDKSQEGDREPSEENADEPLDKENAPEEQELEKDTEESAETEIPDVPLVFAFENVNVDYDEIKNLIANDLEMCFIDFLELVRNDGSSDGQFDNDEAMTLLRGILKQDSVSYSNGFFIFKFPFSILSEAVIEQLLKLGDLSFVCKVRENKSGQGEETEETEELKLFSSSLNEKIRIIFITDDNAIDELRNALQGIIDNKKEAAENQNPTNLNNEDIKDDIGEDQEQNNDEVQEQSKDEVQEQSKDEVQEQSKDEEKEQNNDNTVDVVDDMIKGENTPDDLVKEIDEDKNDTNLNDVAPKEDTEEVKDETNGVKNKIEDGKDALKDDKDSNKNNDIHENEELVTDDKTEDSTGKDVEDLISDDTLNDNSKPPTSLKDEENQGVEEVDDTHSQASTIASGADETQREKAVLERQTNIYVETETETNEKMHEQEEIKATLIRQNTYSAEDVKRTEINEGEDSSTKEIELEKELDTNDVVEENDGVSQQDENAERTTEEENDMLEKQIENKSDAEISDKINDAKDNIEEHEQENTETSANKIDEDDKLEENDKAPLENSKNDNTETENNSKQEEIKDEDILPEQKENCSEEPDNISSQDVDNDKSQSEKDKNTEKIDSGDANDVENKSEEVVPGDNEDSVEKDESGITSKQEIDLKSQKNVENSEQNEPQEDHEKQPTEIASTENEETQNEVSESNKVLEQEANITEEILDVKTETEEGNDAENENDANVDNNDKNDIPSEEVQQDSSEKGISEHEVLPEEKEEDEETDKDNQQQKLDDSSNNVNSSKEKHVIETKVHRKKHKSLDIDSDSNDENVTIETTAEVHAVDCMSPATAEGEGIDSKTTEDEVIENKETDNVKSDVETSKSEKLSVNEDDDVSSKNKKNETVEEKNVENDNESEILIMEGMDGIGSERLSGKRQERNGSGILDESREQDQREAEEPQERSSSSSRGEL